MSDVSIAPGVYRGVVADNRDPLNKNRLKLKVPQLLQNHVTDWAWPIETFTISTSLPKPGQMVWVMFEGGNPMWPVWAGTFSLTTGNTGDYMFNAISNIAALNTLSAYLKTTTAPDGVRSIDMLATLTAMATALKNHEQRITAEENKPDLT
jgi:hypothetical protein